MVLLKDRYFVIIDDELIRILYHVLLLSCVMWSRQNGAMCFKRRPHIVCDRGTVNPALSASLKPSNHTLTDSEILTRPMLPWMSLPLKKTTA